MLFSKVGRLLRHTRNHFFPGTVILLYHRVIDRESDPQLLSVSCRNFEEHLRILSQAGTASLGSLVTSQRSPGGSVAATAVVTFDDGYADNLWHAKPLLDRYGIPATIFVSVDYVLNRRPYWWDEMEKLLLAPRSLPEMLSVTIGRSRRQWCLGDSATYQTAHPQYRHWNVLSSSDPSPRHTAYRQLCASVRELRPCQREAVLDELCSVTGVERRREKGDACSPEELQGLQQPGLIDIGAHTCTHPVLSRLDASEQWTEIRRSKELLEQITGNPVEAFSYPFGSSKDYGPDTVECVKRSGFRCACSNFEGHARRSTDPYQLPRYLVRNWDGDMFAQKLKGWWDGG